jgi:hypothetical protein
MARKQTLGQDAEGRFRRSIGWRVSGDKTVQHLFRLGKDETQAKLANIRLEQLWNGVAARWKRLKDEDRAETPAPVWDETTLAIGQAIAKGDTSCAIFPPPDVLALPAEMQVAWLGRLQADFPIIPLRLVDHDFFVKGVDGIRYVIEVKSKMLSTLGESVSTQTVHEALDAYSAFVGEKYVDKPSNRSQQTAIGLLKQHAGNLLLGKLDADGIETWLAYWCRRPASKDSGNPLALTTCRNVLIVLRQFLRWLNRSPAFGWHLPPAFDFPRCKIVKLPQDRVKKRRHFSITELKTIWQYAKPCERALILLALNCGFSNREIATLQPGEIVRGKRHTFVKRHRTKTEVYAEWVLWPETLEGLEYLKSFQKPGSQYVVVNRAGTALTKGTRTGNENQGIKNHWDNLLKRLLKDHPGFYRLSFKYLRKTGAQLLRRMRIDNAAELASMYLAHGERSDGNDGLLHAYTDRPWKKLHGALLRLRRVLLPVVTSVERPWEYKVDRITPVIREKVLELRAEGKKLGEIADQVGLHKATVGRICRSVSQTSDECI